MQTIWSSLTWIHSICFRDQWKPEEHFEYMQQTYKADDGTKMAEKGVALYITRRKCFSSTLTFLKISFENTNSANQ